MDSPPSRRIRAVLKTTGAVVLVSFACADRMANWPKIWDVVLWDETGYMGIGLYYQKLQLNYESSPLYAMLYYLLHFVVPSPLSLFFVVGLGVTVAAIAALFTSVWLISRSLFLAVAIVALLLAGDFLSQDTRSCYAAVTVLTLGLAAGLRADRTLARATVLTFAALLLTFIRPEFILSFYIFLTAWTTALLYETLRRRRSTRRLSQFARTVPYLAATLALCLCWGFPIPHGGARAYWAFADHFAERYRERFGFTSNFLAHINSNLMMARQFPGATSEWQALLQQPSVVIQFWVDNALDTTPRMWHMVIGPLVAVPVFAIGFTLLTGAAALIWLYRRRGPIGRARAIGWDLLFLGGFAPPLLATYVLVGPQGDYLVSGITLAAIAMAVLVRHLPKTTPGGLTVALAAFAVIAMPRFPPVHQPVLLALRALERQGHVGRLMSADGYWCFYMPDVCETYVVPYASSTSLARFATENSLDAIILSQDFVDFAKSRDQMEFLAQVRQDPGEWRQVPLGGDWTLLRRAR